MAGTLTDGQRALLERIRDALAGIPGVEAVALGGSHARGAGRPDSDLDVGLYDRDAAPFDPRDVAAVAGELDPRPGRVVTARGEWGPWVDGGAWLVVEGQPVDLLYRSLDRLDREIARAERGEREWDYAQQPVHGFHSYILLAELDVCRPLHDPRGALAERKARVAGGPPEALRARVVQDFLWHAEFTLFHARKAAARGDGVLAAGALHRAAAALVQVAWARAGRWFLTDAAALDALAPDEAATLRRILAAPGADAATLSESVARLASLVEAAVDRAGAAYRRPFALDVARRRA